MSELIQRVQKSRYTVYWLAALSGALVFFMIYGVRVLNPTHTDWIMLAGGDLPQHYLGWTGYRNSDWTFPIGMMDTLSYPHRMCIIFTDSIPLFAVFFKAISFALPESFQYFGLWGLMCFMLQAVLAARILQRYSSSLGFLLFSATLLSVSTVVIHRMFTHTALAANWIILFGLEALFNYDNYCDTPGRFYVRAALLGLLSSSTHIYYVLMSGIVLAGLCLMDLLHGKKLLRSVIILGIYLVCAVFIIALLGGFSSGVPAENGGLGLFGFNLNAFFNPLYNSVIFRDLPICSSRQVESYCYLGAGCILALLVALFLLIDFNLHQHWKRAVVFLTLFLVSFACALSPDITLNDRILLTLELPEILIKFWSIFRATGRFIWIAFYLIQLISLAAIGKLSTPRQAFILVMVCLSLQIYDLHLWIDEHHDQFSQPLVWESGLDDEVWSDLAANDSLQHVVFSALTPPQHEMYLFADWATQHDKTVNTFYFARSNPDRIQTTLLASLSQPSPENIYIFFEDNLHCCSALDLHYYQADKYVIGTVQPLEGREELPLYTSFFTWTYPDGQYISEGGGHDEAQHRILYPGGYAYGPYLPFSAGTWEILLEGRGLDQAHVMVYSQFGAVNHPFQVTATSEQLRIELPLTKAVDDLEIFIQNGSNSNIRIDRFRFRGLPPEAPDSSIR